MLLYGLCLLALAALPALAQTAPAEAQADIQCRPATAAERQDTALPLFRLAGVVILPSRLRGGAAPRSSFARCDLQNTGKDPLPELHLAYRLTHFDSTDTIVRSKTNATRIAPLAPGAQFSFLMANECDDASLTADRFQPLQSNRPARVTLRLSLHLTPAPAEHGTHCLPGLIDTRGLSAGALPPH